MNPNTTRNQILAAADRLFYQQGFEHTSFAHIAEAVSISRGNFYYHFKTKDEILDAVIQQRQAATRAMIERWEREAATPAERIKCYIDIVLVNWDKIRQHGCPVGTLCSELAKLGHTSHPAANTVFTLFREWLCQQFKALGCGREADSHAMHVLAWSQGVAVLGNTFQDERFVRKEVRRMSEWLDSLAAE